MMEQSSPKLEHWVKKDEESDRLPARLVVGLEGGIGQGKSTTTRRLVELSPSDTRELRETVDQPFLDLFYSDVGKYAFSFQISMLQTRLHQLDLVRHFRECKNPGGHLPSTATNSSEIGLRSPVPTAPLIDSWDEQLATCFLLLWDRSMIGDYAFARWNHRLGSISDVELAVYEHRFGATLGGISDHTFWKELDLSVFLCGDPAESQIRIREQRKNPAEKDIPLSYLDGIDAVHFDILLRSLVARENGLLNTPVAVLCFGQYPLSTEGDPQGECLAIRRFFEKASQGAVRLGRVLTGTEKQLAYGCVKIARSLEDCDALLAEDLKVALPTLSERIEIPSDRARSWIPKLGICWKSILDPVEVARPEDDFRHWPNSARQLICRQLARGGKVLLI